MNEAKESSDLVSATESRTVSETIARKLSLVRSAEDAEDRIPRIRTLLYQSILAQLDNQIGMCEAYESNGVNYVERRREIARWETIHRRMKEHGETREFATQVIDNIERIERERMTVLLSALSPEQTQELARQAALRQIELQSQQRYVKARRGLESVRDHLFELRQLRALVSGLLSKGE